MTRLAFRRGSEERGVTLIETLLVLGIATAFIAGGIGLYNQAQTAQENRDAVTNVYSVVVALRSTFGAARAAESYPPSIGAASIGLEDLSIWAGVDAEIFGVDDDGTAATGRGAYFEIVIDTNDAGKCALVSATLSQQFHVIINDATTRGSALTGLDEPMLAGTCSATGGVDVVHIYGA